MNVFVEAFFVSGNQLIEDKTKNEEFKFTS